MERRLSIITSCTPEEPSIDSDSIYFGAHEFHHNVDLQAQYAGLLTILLLLHLHVEIRVWQPLCPIIILHGM